MSWFCSLILTSLSYIHRPVGVKRDSEAARSVGDKVDRSRWRLFHNRSHEVVPTYPLHLVVPMAMSDADIRWAIFSYGSLKSYCVLQTC